MGKAQVPSALCCGAVQVNFDLEYLPSACPHKHDLGLSVPSEFMVLPPDTMVVAVFRWTPCTHSHDAPRCAEPCQQPEGYLVWLSSMSQQRRQRSPRHRHQQLLRPVGLRLA